MGGHQLSFGENMYAWRNTLSLKNWASLVNKATESASPKILQLDLWTYMYCITGKGIW